MWPKCTFADQKGLIWNKDMPFGNPLYDGTRNCGPLEKTIFIFYSFYGSKSGVLGQKNGGFECFGLGVR